MQLTLLVALQAGIPFKISKLFTIFACVVLCRTVVLPTKIFFAVAFSECSGFSDNGSDRSVRSLRAFLVCVLWSRLSLNKRCSLPTRWGNCNMYKLHLTLQQSQSPKHVFGLFHCQNRWPRHWFGTGISPQVLHSAIHRFLRGTHNPDRSFTLRKSKKT